MLVCLLASAYADQRALQASHSFFKKNLDFCCVLCYYLHIEYIKKEIVMEIKIFWNNEDKIRWAKEVLKEQGYIVRDKVKVQENIEKARRKRTEDIIKKIEKAKKDLESEGKDVNAHSIAKRAGVNYRTALKYA